VIIMADNSAISVLQDVGLSDTDRKLTVVLGNSSSTSLLMDLANDFKRRSKIVMCYGSELTCSDGQHCG
jgi:hypothetical protein